MSFPQCITVRHAQVTCLRDAVELPPHKIADSHVVITESVLEWSPVTTFTQIFVLND